MNHMLGTIERIERSTEACSTYSASKTYSPAEDGRGYYAFERIVELLKTQLCAQDSGRLTPSEDDVAENGKNLTKGFTVYAEGTLKDERWHATAHILPLDKGNLELRATINGNGESFNEIVAGLKKIMEPSH